MSIGNIRNPWVRRITIIVFAIPVAAIHVVVGIGGGLVTFAEDITAGWHGPYRW